MGRKKTPGLFKRGDTWHIDKQIYGQRLRESTGTCDLEEAERLIAHRTEELRLHKQFGIRLKRTFREAATKYLNENLHKRSIESDASRFRVLDPHIGNMTLDSLHMGTLQDFIQKRKKEGVKMRTINQALKVVRHILNLATTEWMDESGLTWLAFAPKIKLLPEPDLRKPYPLNWDEQRRSSKSYHYIWQGCHCLRLTQDVAMLKSALLNGTGKLKSPNWKHRSLLCRMSLLKMARKG